MARRSIAKPSNGSLINRRNIHTNDVNAGWGGNLNTTNSMHQVFRGKFDRMERYRQYDWMDNDSDIARALDIITEHCSERDAEQRYFRFHWFTDEATAEIGDTLKAHMDQWCRVNRIKKHLFKIMRNTLKYGDWFMFRNPYTFELFDIHPADVLGAIVDKNTLEILGWVIRNFRWNIEDLEIDVENRDIQQQLASFKKTSISKTGTPHSRVIPAIHIKHFSLGEGKLASSNNQSFMTTQSPWPFGGSWLEKSYTTFKKRELLEDSIIIHRTQRAPSRLVWYIDFGRMRKDRQSYMIQNFKNEINQKRIPQISGNGIDGSKGVDSVYNPLSQLEDYYIPISMEQRGSKVEQLEGTPWTDLPDLDYYKSKMAAALRVPYAWLQPTGEGGGITSNDSKQGVATQEEVEFSRFCSRVQMQLVDEFDHEFKLYANWRGVNVNWSDFEVQFNPPTDYEDSRNRARLLESVAAVKELLGIPFISKRLTLKLALGWTDDMITTNERMVDEETNRESPVGGNADMIGGGIGGIPPLGDIPPGGMGLEASDNVSNAGDMMTAPVSSDGGSFGGMDTSTGGDMGAMENIMTSNDKLIFEDIDKSLYLPDAKITDNDKLVFEDIAKSLDLPDAKITDTEFDTVIHDKSVLRGDPIKGEIDITMKMLKRIRQNHFSKRVQWQKRLNMLNRIYSPSQDDQAPSF